MVTECSEISTIFALKMSTNHIIYGLNRERQFSESEEITREKAKID